MFHSHREEDSFEESIPEGKYDLPVSCRLPGALLKEFDDEAAIRGITRAKHVASILIASRQKSDTEKAFSDRLLRESALQKQELESKNALLARKEAELAHSRGQLESLQETRRIYDTYKGVWDVQVRNEAILKALYEKYQSQPIGVEVFYEAGFDFTILVKSARIEGKSYQGLFHYGYHRKENGDIIIQPLIKQENNKQ